MSITEIKSKLFKKPAPKAKKSGHEGNDFWIAMLFCLPWLIGFGLFSAYPIIQSFAFSFNNVSVTAKGVVQNSVGWSNYASVLTADPHFIEDLQSYLQQMLVYVPVIIVVSLTLALR